MVVKRVLKSVVYFTLERLPDPAKRRLFRYLLPALKTHFGITHVVATGEYGAIMGSADDKIVLAGYYLDRTWTPKKTDLFRKALENGGVFIDIGSNIGLSIIPISQNQKVRCIGFEPDKKNLVCLKTNIELNSPHPNVEIHACALYHENCTLDIVRNSMNSGDTRLGDSAVVAEDSDMTTKAVRLDDFISPITETLAVKIDTQGAEPFVISGGNTVISSASLISLEFWPWGMRDLNADPKIVLAFLREHFDYGVVLFREGDFEGQRLQPIKQIIAALRELDNENAAQFHFYCDVIAVKSPLQNTINGATTREDANTIAP